MLAAHSQVATTRSLAHGWRDAPLAVTWKLVPFNLQPRGSDEGLVAMDCLQGKLLLLLLLIQIRIIL